MYHKCSKCGVYVDDGVMRDDKIMCEKCLYEEEKEGDIPMNSKIL